MLKSISRLGVLNTRTVYNEEAPITFFDFQSLLKRPAALAVALALMGFLAFATAAEAKGMPAVSALMSAEGA